MFLLEPVAIRETGRQKLRIRIRRNLEISRAFSQSTNHVLTAGSGRDSNAEENP